MEWDTNAADTSAGRLGAAKPKQPTLARQPNPINAHADRRVGACDAVPVSEC
jgi:hypothetical protein